jgi:hypothetical protein
MADVGCSLCYKDRWISARKYVLANALVTVTFLVTCFLHVIDPKGMILVMCIMHVIDPKGMISVLFIMHVIDLKGIMTVIKALLLNPFMNTSNSVHHPHFIS